MAPAGPRPVEQPLELPPDPDPDVDPEPASDPDPDPDHFHSRAFFLIIFHLYI